MKRSFIQLKKPKGKDNSFIFTILAFLGFGLFMIADSTVITSNTLYGEPYRFVLLQLGWIILGLVCFFVFYNFDYKKLSRTSYFLFLFNVIALIILAIVGLFPCSINLPFSPCVNGANRWLYLNPPPLPAIPFLGVIGFQPGELAKLTIILYLSVQLSKNIKEGGELFWVYMVTASLLAGLILLEPNMSTAVMVFALGTIVYFVSGAPIKPVIITVPIIIALSVMVILVSPYRRSRLMAMFSGSDDQTSSYHVKQALMALGSGGVMGVGFGQSKQKYQYLPEVASDSIFAIIGEEFGFVGTILVTIAYLYLVYKGFEIAKNAPDLLGKLIASGISSWLGIQFFINVAAMTKIIPLTGVPIPLISYGGSSMIFSLMGLGILANISKESSQ
ncbi:cell division protein FtsW [candidate division WWE3 bacterium]|uniref:Probable peptidoglycan glycosyltransferase FtsW n=1 Tax=candidate division WWE3 bacterium TaxID=2053526 RepID=A0A7X9E6U4_UNCKA|nr:cell division protein FtsW [candidate division WWE3 bacterium]